LRGKTLAAHAWKLLKPPKKSVAEARRDPDAARNPASPTCANAEAALVPAETSAAPRGFSQALTESSAAPPEAAPTKRESTARRT
jgi:hypothetical protein